MAGHTESTMDFMYARIEVMESRINDVRNLLNEYEQEYITHSQFIIKLRLLVLDKQ